MRPILVLCRAGYNPSGRRTEAVLTLIESNSQVIGSWRLPRTSLSGSLAATNSVALAALLVSSSVLRTVLPLGALYPWKTAATFIATLAIAARFVAAHHPFTRFGPANQATTVRALLVALVAGFLGEPGLPSQAAAAAALTVAVAGLDGVDGWLARRSRMASAFGARFDMEVDALLIMILSILIWQFRKAGPWVLASGLLRYAFVVGGWARPWLTRPLPPSRRRQTICVLQIVGLTVALAPAVPSPVSAWIAAIALASLVYSFAVDVVWLWRRRVVDPAR
jgi:phosphatidylglycerophosphate synthase